MKKPNDDDLKSLNDLNDKINAIKSKNVEKEKVSTKGVGVGMKIATDMLSGLLVGVFIGYQLDTYFQTKPLWLIVFLIIGLGAGIRNVMKTAKRLEDERKNINK
ncbi:MAG: AtpZ/AtpI family protein [Alphaproteobacteria bacterium]